MIWFILFIVFNCVNCTMMGSLGYGADTWQYWVGIICVCGSYMVGRFYEAWR